MQAVMLLRAGDASAARDLLITCLQYHPRATDAYLTLAQLEEAQGRFDAARAVYQQATGAEAGGRSSAPQVS
jgi:Tfp pilus assembly protein PilF